MAACRLHDHLSDGAAWSSDEIEEASFIDRGDSVDHSYDYGYGNRHRLKRDYIYDTEAPAEEADALVAASRAYQLEMFEESLKKNIIVAMDTGTGKTRVAILRIRTELERSPLKIVWFLATTVFLCDQQFKAIVSQIPGAQAKIITGQSGVDAWSTQAVWDTVLLNVRIVVATHQVLLDAMHHGFVKISSISLLVFDEAHACVKEHAGKRIMSEFYYPALNRGEVVPAILGMTASPVHGTKLDGLDKLEQTLHAVCRTPKRHRAELVAHTKQPTTSAHVCDPRAGLSAPIPQNAARLQQVYDAGEIRSFTENVLAYKGGEGDVEVNTKDYDRSWAFLKAFCRRTCHVYAELGSWSADYYVHKVIRRCVNASNRKIGPEGRRPYLLFLLKQVRSVAPAKPVYDANADCSNNISFLSCLSAKVLKLVEILEACEARRPTGIVFVKERPMAAVLARVLSLHPRLHGRFRAGHVVGMSQMYTDVYEAALVLNPRKGSQEALQLFRGAAEAGEAGRGRREGSGINLLVATSVMEEGIDVPACNLVVCIDELTSLKAYIQRRGRAREEKSQMHLLLGEDLRGRRALTHEWEELEHEMKRRYEDGLRELADLDGQSRDDGLDDENIMPPLEVASTQAKLGARDAKNHLDHFCATSTSARFVDWQPVYILEEYEGDGEYDGDFNGIFTRGTFASPRLLRATVQLPITLPAHLRRACSKYAWRQEEDACADAAFQAYKALYAAGLIGDNLLPPKATEDDGLAGRTIEGRPGVVTVHARQRPWTKLAQAWTALDAAADGPERWLYRHAMRLVDSDGVELYHADMLLPGGFSGIGAAEPMDIAPVRMFWSPQSTRPWTMEFGPRQRELVQRGGGDGGGKGDDDQTTVLLNAAYGHRWPIKEEHRLVRIERVDEPRPTTEQVGTTEFSEALSAGQLSASSSDPRTSYLVRGPDGSPYLYQGYSATKPAADQIRRPYKGFDEDPDDVPYVLLRPLPKQVGSLHRVVNCEGDGEGEEQGGSKGESKRPFYTVLPAASCRVDRMPMAAVQFGALIPPLMQVLEVHLVAAELLSLTRLRELPVSDRSLITTAISAPAARLHDNYEVLEFIGDAVLKLMAAANCAAQNLDAPEGHLSLFKDRLVANSRLCRAATEFGLDRFIVGSQWSLREWRDVKIEAEEEKGGEQLVMSTKTLADVVEALIGAALVDGGLTRALECMRILLPERQPWLSLEKTRATLFAAAPKQTTWRIPTTLEELLGYQFRRPSLLAEAMTHPSTPGIREGGCMERLEFIGDAVLDYVIVQRLLGGEGGKRLDLEHQKMHLLRTTVVNAAFLGFAAMEFSISSEASTVTADGTVTRGEIATPLWAFMRHGGSDEMVRMQKAAQKRHAALRESVLTALWEGSEYPWVQLAQLRLEKGFSDIVEAVIGAVWVDAGSLGPVEALLEKMGVLSYLQRALDEDVHLRHPKEELGRISGNARLHYRVAAGESVLPPLAEVRRKRRRDEEAAQDESSDEDEDEEGDEKREGKEEGARADQAPIFTCRLSINGVCVVEILDGRSREEAEVRAAAIAVRDLKEGKIKVRSDEVE